MSPFGDAEDNAAMLVRFPDALAILEATWTTFHAGVPHGPIVFGNHGTIVVDGTQAKIFTERGNPEPTTIHEGHPFAVGR